MSVRAFLVFLIFLIVKSLSDIPPAKASQSSSPNVRTIIAFELPEKLFSDLFILGGYTDGNETRCTAWNTNSPCSIPITHIIPTDAPAAYVNWAAGDKYLDLNGREPQQGSHKGEKAYGTPLRRIGLEEAKYKVRIRNLAYRPRQAYWITELEMDCNKTHGYFEVESVVRTKTYKMMYESLKRPIPGGFTPKDPRRDPQKGHSRLEDKPGRRTPQRPSGNRPSFAELHGLILTKQCVGTVHMDFPYDSHRHIGLCGRVNIFRFRLPYCEINEI